MVANIIGKLILALLVSFGAIGFGGVENEKARWPAKPNCYTEILPLQMRLIVENMQYVDGLESGTKPIRDSGEVLAEIVEDLELLGVSIWAPPKALEKLRETYARMMLFHFEELVIEAESLIAGEANQSSRNKAFQIHAALSAAVTSAGRFSDAILASTVPVDDKGKAKPILGRIAAILPPLAEFTRTDSGLGFEERLVLLSRFERMDDAELERRIRVAHDRMAVGEVGFTFRFLAALEAELRSRRARDRIAGKLREGAEFKLTPFMDEVTDSKLNWALGCIEQMRQDLGTKR